MVLYYAFGGGLGHLTRASAVLYTFGYHENDFLVVTSSPFANIVFKEKNFIYIPDDFNTKPAELCSRIESIIQEFQINVFYVDSFPLGLIGEFIHMKVKKCVIRYIARLLKWNNYVSCLSNFYFRFEETFIIEPLPDVQMDYIIRNSENYKYISLKYPSSENKSDVNQILSKISSPVWLIVHSGNMDEINILQNFAAEIADIEHTKPEYLVVSQTDYKSDSNSQKCINYYPALDFFPYVDKIFTACGYNIMAQTINHIDKHHFIPFNRKYDDQFLRAKYRKVLIRNR